MKIQPLIDAIIAAGGGIYAVGGSVRDEALGFQSKDLDVLVTGIPYKQLSDILANLGTVDEVGKSFGIIKFKLNGKGEDIDVALPRTERSTGEGHCDFEVNCDYSLPIGEDLLRRDFTINAMARNLANGELVDPYGGMEACEKRLLVPVSENSFSDDPLRILRGIQFAARFDLSLEPCREAMRAHVQGLEHISPERIAVELGKLFSKAPVDRLIKSLIELQDIKAWDLLFWSDYIDYVGYYGPVALQYAPQDINIRMALFFFSFSFEDDRGKRAKWAEEVIDRLKLSVMGIQKPLVMKLLNHADSAFHHGGSGANLRKFIAYDLGGKRLLFSKVLEMWACIEEANIDCDPKRDSIRFRLLNRYSCLYIREVEGKPLSLRELAINGNDIQAYGYQGKAVGAKLQEALELVLENPKRNNKEDLEGLLFHD